jgi:4-amino-4-deoxy-L-arabinose transferase-like glycosyltransferase
MGARPSTGRLAVPRPLVYVLLVGLGVRIVLLSATQTLGVPVIDEQHYVELAGNLVDGRGFAMNGQLTSLRPPLYPALVAGVWTVTGRSFQAIRVTQILLALFVTLATFHLTRELYGEGAATWAAAISWLYPSLLYANYLILTEVLFALLVTLVALAIVRLLTRPAMWAAGAAGALIAFAALTRSVLWPFPVVLAVLIVAGVRVSLPRRFALAAVMIVCYAAVLTPWAIRNTRLQGVPVLIDTMGGMNLRMGNYEYTPHERIWDAVSQSAERSWIVGLPRPVEGQSWTEGTKERWARNEALRFMVEHPTLTAWRTVIKFGDFWGLERDFVAGVARGLYTPPRWQALLAGSLMLVTFPIVLFLAVFGVRAPSEVSWLGRLVPLLLVAFVCALHSIVFGHPRYRLPLTPLLTVYAGAALASLGRLPRPVLRRVGWVPVTTCAAFLGLWVVQFLARDWDQANRLLSLMAVR